MKHLTLLTILLLASAAVVAVAASAHDGSETKSALDDAALELKVKTALLTKIGWDMLDVDVEASGGAVRLDGKADTRSHRELALEVARSVDGVDRVDNRIELETAADDDGDRTPVADTVGKGLGKAEAEVRDAILESRVKTALIDAIGTTAFAIEVEATDGEVSLRGDLDDARHQELALETTRKCSGVTQVIDLIRVTG